MNNRNMRITSEWFKLVKTNVYLTLIEIRRQFILIGNETSGLIRLLAAEVDKSTLLTIEKRLQLLNGIR